MSVAERRPEGTETGGVNAENPWPGLHSFGEEDSTFFRGREEEAEALYRLVLGRRLTVLFGVSGLGKSSLLNAGLFPRLRDRLFLPVYIHLRYDADAGPLREQVYARIAEEAERFDIEPPAILPAETLWEHFHRQGNAYWDANNEPVVPLLVFDQFEEAFTLGRSHPDRTGAFLGELGDLIEGRPSEELKARIDAREVDAKAFARTRHAYSVLLTIREDFLADLASLRDAIPSVGEKGMRLSPLSGTAALQVTQTGGPDLVPPEVGEQIVRFVAADHAGSTPLKNLSVDPALLSLFCSELNERRKAQDRSSIGADLLAGSQEKILAAYYERCFVDVDPRLRTFVEERLITEAGYRDSVALEGALRLPGVTRPGVDTLVRRRLIRLEERLGAARVELTHDVLTRVVEEHRRQSRAEEQRAEDAAAAARLRVRRRRTVLSAAALLLVGVGMVAWGGYLLQSARQARAEADAKHVIAQAADSIARVSKDSAFAERARADTARNEARVAAERVALQQASLDIATRKLSLQDQQATVIGEATDRYRIMLGQLMRNRAAQDSALRATVQRDLQQAEGAIEQANAIRASADSGRVAALTAFQDVVSGLCALIEPDTSAATETGKNADTAPQKVVAEGPLPAGIRQVLEQARTGQYVRVNCGKKSVASSP